MKALSTTILIVVTAVVILVAALVVLTIFGGGVGSVSTLTSFKTQCATQCQMTCKLGGVPPTWNVKSTIQGQTKSCHDEFPSDCASAECGSVTTTTTSTTQGCCKYPKTGNCLTTLSGGKEQCEKDGGTWLATCPVDCK